MPNVPTSSRERDFRPAAVQRLPHPSWNPDFARLAGATGYSAADFWRRLGL